MDAEDGSSLTLDQSTPGVIVVRQKDGTAIYFTGSQTAGYTYSKTEDTNGNYTDSLDTLGRPIALSYKNSNGITQTITLNYTQLTLFQSAAGQYQTTQPPFTYPMPNSCGICQTHIWVSQPAQKVYNMLTSVVLPDNTSYTFTYNGYGELTKVTYPTGGYTAYDYAAFVHEETFWDLWNMNIPGDFREVTRRRICRDPAGACGGQTPEDITSFTPTVDATQPANQQMDVVDALGYKHHYAFSKVDDNVCAPYSSPHETLHQLYSETGILLRTTTTSYISGWCGSQTFPSDVTTTLNDTGGTPLVTSMHRDYDTYTATVMRPPYDPNNYIYHETQAPTNVANPIDNPTQVLEYSYGSGAVGTLARKTVNTWLKVNAANANVDYSAKNIHIWNRKASAQVFDSGGITKFSETQYEYDSYAATAPITASGAVQHDPAYGAQNQTRGNLTASKRWRNTDNTFIATQYRYDDAGNTTKVIDPLGDTTILSYADSWGNAACAPTGGSAAAYLTSATDALNHITTATYNSCTGTIASITDPNGMTTRYPAYDSMDRLLQTTYADGGQVDRVYSISAKPFNVKITKKVDAARNAVSQVFVDGLARTTQSIQCEDGTACTQRITTDTTYDGLGRTNTVSNPYRSASDSTYGITTTNYDALNRITKVIPPDGSAVANNVTKTYVGNCTTVTDQAGKSRKSCSDALGRLIEVDEPGPASIPATYSSGSVTINCAQADCTDRSTQTSGQPAVSASGSFMIQGNVRVGPDGITYDSGDITLSVGTSTFTAFYDQFTNTTSAQIAGDLSCQVNRAATASVTAPCPSNSSTVYLTARQAGSAGNTISWSLTESYDRVNFSSPPYALLPASGSLSGGKDAVPPATAYDTGTVSVIINNGTPVNVSYGQGSSAATISSALLTAFNGHPLVTATLSGTTLSFTSKVAGAASNYTLSASSSTNSTYFTGTSFPAATSGATFTGGRDAVPGGLDAPRVTLYQYDALDNLTCAVQKGTDTSAFTKCASAPAAWRPRSFTYNSLSQLTSATNPESGTITYSYDNNGNLLTKTAPAPNQAGAMTVTTTYVYDPLNRLTQKSYSDPTPVVKFGYDGVAPASCTLPTLTITNGIGKRTGMCDGAGAEAWSYAITPGVGWEITDARTTNGARKTSLVQNNLGDSIATLNYPSGNTVTYTSDSAGRMLSVVDTTNTAALLNYGTGAAYAPQGALSALTLGQAGTFTGINLNQDFNRRLQPASIRAWSTNGVALDLTYNFSLGTANNGNVTSITNNRNAERTQIFMYDELNRIKTAATQATTGANAWGQQFGYDAWGNLLSAAVTQGSVPMLSQSADANNRIVGYCYDAAGNLLAQSAPPCPVPAYTYNAENQLTATAGVTYTYDGDGRRVQKSNGTIYWYGMGSDPLNETDLTGATTNAAFKEFVFFNGKRIARRDYLNNVNYYFADHLGTARVVTNSSGAILDDSDFYPFGGERPILSSSGNNYKFTGKERDSESGLDNFGARYNSSSLGRFISPDESKYSSKLDPQSWNLYSYVGNDPLGRIDPDGHNYFWINGGYEWHDGSSYEYTDKRGKIHKLHSDYNYLLITQKTGHMTADGADEVQITLKGPGDKVIINQAYGFSGGNVDGTYHLSTPKGRYEINLNNRGGPETNHSTASGELAAWHNGIQEIAAAYYDPFSRDYVSARNEWGSLRANLSRLNGEGTSYYLHGKELERSSTHGCTCNRDESVLREIFKLNPNGVGEGDKRGIVAVSVQ
jgi:RHS repeat-associated protein